MLSLPHRREHLFSSSNAFLLLLKHTWSLCAEPGAGVGPSAAFPGAPGDGEAVAQEGGAGRAFCPGTPASSLLSCGGNSDAASSRPRSNVSQTEGSSWHTCIQTTFKTAEFGGLIGRAPAVTDHSGGNVRDTVYAETPLTELSKSLWSVQQRAGSKHGCGQWS